MKWQLINVWHSCLFPAILALILFSAGLLKIVQLRIDMQHNLLEARQWWLILAETQVELLLACWLVSGWARDRAKSVGSVVFGFFAIYNVSQWLYGLDDCGCFGAIKVDPKITFAFDCLALIAIALWRPKQYSFLPNSAFYRNIIILSGLLVIQCVSLIGVDFWLRGSGHLGDLRESVLILRPEEWVGKPMPLLEAIDMSDNVDIAIGNWILIFYQSGCKECDAFLSRIAQGDSTATGLRGARLVFVSVSDGPVSHIDLPGERGQLIAKEYLFLATPVAVLTQNGLVDDVTTRADVVLSWR